MRFLVSATPHRAILKNEEASTGTDRQAHSWHRALHDLRRRLRQVRLLDEMQVRLVIRERDKVSKSELQGVATLETVSKEQLAEYVRNLSHDEYRQIMQRAEDRQTLFLGAVLVGLAALVK